MGAPGRPLQELGTTRRYHGGKRWQTYVHHVQRTCRDFYLLQESRSSQTRCRAVSRKRLNGRHRCHYGHRKSGDEEVELAFEQTWVSSGPWPTSSTTNPYTSYTSTRPSSCSTSCQRQNWEIDTSSNCVTNKLRKNFDA